MNHKTRLRRDHALSIAVSVLLNGALFTAMLLLITFEPDDHRDIQPTLIIDPTPQEDVKELEKQIIEELNETPPPDTYTDFIDPSAPDEPVLEDIPEVVSTPETQNLDQIARLLSDIASPVTLLGLGSGVPAGGGSSGFGGEGGASTDLVGTLYDLKRTSKGEPRNFNFSADLRALIDARFSGKALDNVFRIPKQLRLSHLFVPSMSANAGPESFGVAELMQPRGWVVHYQGHIQPSIPGTYRFVGDFDDVILVMIDGEVVMESNWGSPATDWRPAEAVPSHPGLRNRRLMYGDWIRLGNSPRRIDIIVGENPGGHVGGHLMVQEKNTRYRETAAGRPILPLFTLHPLQKADYERFAASN